MILGLALAAALWPFAAASAADAAPADLARTRAAAASGDSRAQVKLGWMYENGSGAARDYAEAVRWYRKAAEQGNGDGQNSLGWMYQNGWGVAQDYAAAAAWYEKSAAQGNVAGAVDLGWLYENGAGVARDYGKAVALYRQAAAQGDGDGENALGWMYQNGFGAARSDDEAAAWYRKAAAHGSARARGNLAALEALKKEPAAPPPESRPLAAAASPAPAAAAAPPPGRSPLLPLAAAAFILAALVYYFGWLSPAGALLLVKALAAQSPRRAYAAYGRYRALGGKPGSLTAGELYAAFKGSGRLVELVEEPELSASQAVAVAGLLSADGDDFHALRLLAAERPGSAPLSDREHEDVVRVYERAGALGDLADKVCVGKTEAYLSATAAALKRLGKPSESARVLKLLEAPARADPRASAAAAPPAAAADAGVVAGRYELQQKIGEGGMGLVFLGYDRKLSRRVAIKKMRPELRSSPGGSERFVREARIISHLTHPHIVGVHDVVEERGDVFLVMDFVDGRPLSAALAERGRLPLKECVGLFEQVCAAVHVAHESRVLHRDLKPANVMIGKDGYARVTDFGLAREAKDSVSQVTHLDSSGTPAYMAPEQHMGRGGRPADVFALGVCVYETLTGALPFTGPDFLVQKERRKYPPPQFLAPELPPTIEAFVADVLEPDPKKRVADARELLARLKAV